MSKSNQRIPVGNLRPGMYVVKLDRPWLSTPFDPQGFPISSEIQVKLLAKYCKSVYVESGRGGRVGAVKKTLASARPKPAARKGTSGKKAAARAR